MDIRKRFQSNLKHLILLSGKQQSHIADELNIRASTFSDWTTGKSYPRAEALQSLADYFGIALEDLIGGGERTPDSQKQIPVFSRLVAGGVQNSMDLIVGYEEIPLKLSKTGEHIALRVRDDSMSPQIQHGDVVIIRLQDEVMNGEIAVVMVGRDDATCKRVLINDYGITLTSLNPAIEPVFFKNSEVKSIPVRIVGKVIESRRKF